MAAEDVKNSLDNLNSLDTSIVKKREIKENSVSKNVETDIFLSML